MEWRSLLEMAREGDRPTVRFLKEVGNGDDVGALMVGFANTVGGQIVVGMDVKNYHLMGTDIDDQWIQKRIQHLVSPKIVFDVDVVARSDKQVVVISVEEGKSKPYFYKHRCYVIQNGVPQMVMVDPNEALRQLEAEEKGELVDDVITSFTEADEIIESDYLVESTRSSVTEVSVGYSEVVLEETSSNVYTDAMAYGPTGRLYSDVTVVDQSLNARQESAVAYLKTHASIKNKAYRKLFNVSHKTAHLELVDLVKKGYIRTEGKGRSTCYTLNRVTA